MLVKVCGLQGSESIHFKTFKQMLHNLNEWSTEMKVSLFVLLI